MRKKFGLVRIKFNESERKLTRFEINVGNSLLYNQLKVCLQTLEINDVKNNKNCLIF